MYTNNGRIEILEPGDPTLSLDSEHRIIKAFTSGVAGRAAVYPGRQKEAAIIQVGDFNLIQGTDSNLICSLADEFHYSCAGFRIGSQILPDYHPLLPWLNEYFIFEETIRYSFQTAFTGFGNSEKQRMEVISRLRDLGIRIFPITSDYASLIINIPELSDLLIPLGGPESFLQNGFGLCAINDQGKVVGSIGTYVLYPGWVEIQIDVLPDWQGNGIGYALGLFFLSECRGRGLQAHWDAMNYRSAQLARKLGFGQGYSYPVISIQGKKA